MHGPDVDVIRLLLGELGEDVVARLAPSIPSRTAMRVAQRLWIQYRDANCPYYGLGEGTIARVEAGDCMLRMTQSRAIELEGKEDRK